MMNSRHFSESVIHANLPPRAALAYEKAMWSLRNKPESIQRIAQDSRELQKLGLGFYGDSLQSIAKMHGAAKRSHAMDFLQPTVTTGSIITPIQFLQEWLPGFVHVITAARKIDILVGCMTAGAWEDYEIVQALMELTGGAAIYSDNQNVPLANLNNNFVTRNVVRFEQGLAVKRLEQAVAARNRISVDAMKRDSVALSLEISRNSVGFFGVNAGGNNTYGFLNDPGLPAYVPVANGASGSSTWATKTFLEITADIRSWISALRLKSKDTVDTERMNLTMALPTASVDFLSVTNQLGSESVRQWLTQTYPNIRVESAPELDAASGGQNVAYLYADQVRDNSSDGGQTFVQVVPVKFMVLGVQQMAKGYEEDYTMASAGVMCKRPWAVYRASGI